MKIIRWFIRLVMLVLVVAFVAAGYVFFDYQRFLRTPVVVDGSAKTFTIASGDSVATLVRKFPKQGLVLAQKSPLRKYLARYYFRYLAKESGTENRLKIGEYQLKKGMQPLALLKLFSSDKTVAYKVQFIEGRTFKQLRRALDNNANLKHSIAGMSDADIMKAVGEPTITHPEGMFFPDTYQFHNQSQDISVLKNAYQLMQKNLQKAWEARDPDIKLKSPYELLILASIIEKETGVNSERDKVSGVFHRRLAKNMLLQTDPTVIYGLGDSYDGTIYKSDLKADTPYNTYLHKGLPPTPIAMPSMASLMAAGQPDKGDSIFFVADGDGGHLFTPTYAEHKKAVKAYRQRLKDKNQQPEVNSQKDKDRPTAQ
ncbi:MAG: aminodeoxychorismate lyase [Gammaproteobacteria bacterium]|nr:MAG: aminodeoxychorismate lyase [Gammaproteobacteria bacterium]